MNTLLAIVGLSMLIVLHEAGHFGVARAAGMRVLRFSLGLGPTLLGWHFAGTLWQLGWIPFGGYVEIDGMAPKEEDREEEEGKTEFASNPIPQNAQAPQNQQQKRYNDAPAWQRAAVLFAGPAVNWLVAAGIFAAIAATSGMRIWDPTDTRLGALAPSGAAATAGLEFGDKILRIDDAAITGWAELVAVVRAHPNTDMVVHIERAGERLSRTVRPDGDSEGVGKIGAAPHGRKIQHPPAQAMLFGMQQAGRGIVELLSNLWASAFEPQSSVQLLGLPGIVRDLRTQAATGWAAWLQSLASLSLGLFVFNLLPLPALDGGRLLFLAWAKIRGRPVSPKLEAIIHSVGMLLLLGLLVWVSIRDVL